MDQRLLRQTRETAEGLMAAHGLVVERWEFGFNTNLRRAGVCCHPHRGKPGRIELSVYYVARNQESHIRDTILHEIAHALVGPGHGHDAIWKDQCVRIGARPERCYGDEVDMPKGRWRATCGGCKKEYDKHREPKRKVGWFCRSCGKDKGALVWKPFSGRKTHG